MFKKKTLKIGIIFLLAICLYGGCSSNKSGINQHAFYYWETNFNLDESDLVYFNELSIKKLYIHFFDVEYESQAVPAGIIRFNTKIPANFEIVPVVFITNKTISSLDTIGIRDLSQKIVTRVQKEILRTQIIKQVSEVQIDCDWTKSTRHKYFYLLNLIKESLPYTVSATIRLHQYKYFKDNLPPVEKGMLMCYNVNDPTEFKVNNSLFDKAEVLKYIKGVNYPLPLDLAMPAFSWGVMFNAQEKFLGFANSIQLKEIQKDTNFVNTDRPNVFLAKNQTYSWSNYFEQGTLVRIEESNLEQELEIVDYLKKHLQQADATITLFHYNRLNNNNENKSSILQLLKASH